MRPSLKEVHTVQSSTCNAQLFGLLFKGFCAFDMSVAVCMFGFECYDDTGICVIRMCAMLAFEFIASILRFSLRV